MIKNLSQWDEKNIQIILKLIKKYNSTFIDCGSNNSIILWKKV